MTLTTANMGLLQAQGTDNARDYLKTFLAASLASIDAHDHSSTKGVPVKRLANGTFASRPAAGNAGHVYLATDANRVTWDNGSSWIEAVINATSQAVSLGGGLTVTAGGLAVSAGGLTVAAGGETITAGGLTVTAGNVGVGNTAIANRGIFVNGAITSNSGVGALVGIDDNPSLVAQANNDALYGLQVFPLCNLNTKTGVKAVGIEIPGQAYANAPTAIGVEVGAVAGTGTNNYGVRVSGPTGASVDNIAISAFGDAVLGGGSFGGAMATTDGVGFLYLPSMAGAPTANPLTTGDHAGHAAVVIDTTNSKIWVRVGAAWKSVTVA